MNITDILVNDTAVSPTPQVGACEFTNFEFVGYFYVLTVVCFVGIILNITNIVVFAERCFGATVYVYMSAISLTDAITLLAVLPTGLVRCAGHLEACNQPTFRQFRFHIAYFNGYIGFGLANTAEAASAWLTMIVSIERFMAMKFPTVANIYCRKNAGKMHVIIVLLLAVAFNAPLFFIMRISQQTITLEDGTNRTVLASQLTAFGESTDYDVYIWFRFVFVQLFPLIALCIFNSLLLNVVGESYRKLRKNDALQSRKERRNQRGTVDLRSTVDYSENDLTKHQRIIRQKHMDRRQRAQTKLTIMQICIIFLFLIGQIPQAFSFEKISNAIIPRDCGACCTFKNFYRLCSQVLSQISYSLSFFIYLGLNRYFRETFMSCCRKPPIDQYRRQSGVV